MDMTLDKIKSMALALFAGLMASGIGAGLALQLVARQHQMTAADSFRFGVGTPLKYWPLDMVCYAMLSAAIGVTVATLLFMAIRHVRWTYRSRRLDGPEAAHSLLAKSTRKGPRIFAGKFGGKSFFAGIEDRGLVIGPPGTGKTAFLFNQVLRAMKERQHFVAVDFKPELYRTLARSLAVSGYQVLSVNPSKTGIDTDHWNPLDDIQDEIDIAELCTALLPIRDAKEAPFVESQRDWLKAAVFHESSINGGSIPRAFNLLSSSGDPLALLEIFSRSKNTTAARLARRMVAGLSGGKPDPLILQGLTGALRALDYLGLEGVQDAIGYSDFSVRQLGKGDQPIALFLQFEESKINALGPLLSFMANGVLTSLITTAEERNPVFLFLDELGNMPPIPNLPQKLNTIRSRKIPTWMYFQTTEQMEIQYGRGAISTFFASSDFQMVFRLNDQSTRDLISKLIGTTLKQKITRSRTGERGGTTRTHETVLVIEPHELGQLKPSNVVALYRGSAAKGLATPHFVDFPEFRRQ